MLYNNLVLIVGGNKQSREAFDDKSAKESIYIIRLCKRSLRCRGSSPHPSHDNPSDPEDVLSVRLKNEDKKTTDRIHVHQDESVRR